MNKSLLKLLSQFMFGKITPGEFKALRSELRQSSEDEIRSAMEVMWDDERTPATISAESRLRILDDINQNSKKAALPYWLKAASIIILPLMLIWGTYMYTSRQNTLPQQADMVVTTGSGQKTQITLPDGSRVWLNSKSSFSYPVDFGFRNRTVHLKGEGYFEITKNEKKRFSVETDDVNIVVHGTKFNVSAHTENPEIRVSLLEGSVAIENKEHKLLDKLIPLHIMKINKGDLQFNIISENTHLTTLWSQNKCQIDEVPAEEMFRRMGYWYGLNIKLENINTEYHYSFTIKEESFREFLELINELTPLEYSINGEEVIIKYK